MVKPKQRKKRKETYGGQVRAALAEMWEIFDYPCGERPKPILGSTKRGQATFEGGNDV